MKRLLDLRFLLIIVSCFSLSAHASYAYETPPSFADLVEKLTPSVVNISTTQKIKGTPGLPLFELPNGEDLPPEFRDFFEHFANPGGKPIEREVFALGSGFIIDESGYIATNNHVIADAEEITVILSDNTKLKAKIIGRDAKTDLALLKVDAGRKLPAALLGDSDKARVGDWVIAIGNPFGLGGTVTAGIVSARARNLNAGPFDDFIQTDAPINRGNSGGPMFNMKGEVIGINTAIFSPSGGSVGIGFAIPTSLAKSVFTQLKASGHIERGWLGVVIAPVTDEVADSVGLKKPYGALVMNVAKGSPSEKAGIQPGDIITSYDGKEIKEMRNLPRAVAETGIGKTVPVEIWRNGASKTVNVKIGEMKDTEEAATESGGEPGEDKSAPSGKSKEMLGLALAPLTGAERERHDIPANVKGVVITRVKPDSEARQQGIQPGDVITQIGSSPVTTPKEVGDAAAAARKAGRKYVLVRIQRGRETMVFVTLPVKETP